jgi:hypothetical protein
VVGIFAAGVLVGAQEQEQVPLYTNADLEKYGPPETPNPASPATASQSADGRWEFVRDHLDREYTRIATDRRLDLEESLVQPAPEPENVGFRISGRYGLWGYGDFGWGRHRGRDPVWDDFRRYYDQRTARHGYLVPRKNAPPPTGGPWYGIPEHPRRGNRADAARPGRGRSAVYRIAVPSRSAPPTKAEAGGGGSSRSPSRGRVSNGSSGRSGASARATTRGTSGTRGGGGRR